VRGREEDEVTVKEEEEEEETAVVDIIVIFSRTQKRILCDAIEYRSGVMIYFSPRRKPIFFFTPTSKRN
jgi:hypothetical protein